MPRPPRETETDRIELGDRAANSRQVENKPWSRDSKIARDGRDAQANAARAGSKRGR